MFKFVKHTLVTPHKLHVIARHEVIANSTESLKKVPLLNNAYNPQTLSILAYQQPKHEPANYKRRPIQALTLLNDEVESVEAPELSDEYFSVIEKVEAALKELN